jgi:hypothetical protein
MRRFLLTLNNLVHDIVVIVVVAAAAAAVALVLEVDEVNLCSCNIIFILLCFRLDVMMKPLSMWRKFPELMNVGRTFHTSSVCGHIIKLTRLRVVDNSEIGKQAMAEGKPPKCIHIYNKKGVGTIGMYCQIIYEILF